jgi:hypothetical protein
MKRGQVILLLAGGFLLACLAYRAGRKDSVNVNVIKPGDKGNDVYALQSYLSAVTGLKFPNMGAYDNETLKAVGYYMEGTNSLVDSGKGYICRKFTSDLYKIQSRING